MTSAPAFHKVYLAGGGYGLITDCFIVEGNPADAEQALPLLRRHIEGGGMIPAQAAMDGGFASKQNLRQGKELGIADLAFSKKRGLKVEEMTAARRSIDGCGTFGPASRGFVPPPPAEAGTRVPCGGSSALEAPRTRSISRKPRLRPPLEPSRTWR